MARLLIKNARCIVGTHAPHVQLVRGREMADLPVLENAWLLIEDGKIKDLGTMSDLDRKGISSGVRTIDATGRFILPGWSDPHTHVVFAAPREEEFVFRLKGMTYQEIAARGGGILNSASKLRGMSADLLYEQARRRLEEMMRQGTVAVEIKSGYGLSYESELLMLRVVQRLKQDLPLQIKSTLLAAHALPPEFKDDRSGYINMICDRLIPQVTSERLADHVDVFCETNYFTVPEMEQVLEAGARHGLKAKVHVNQFTSIGGIQAAIKYNALSVDHLEVMEPQDIEALAKAFAPAPDPETHPERSRGALDPETYPERSRGTPGPDPALSLRAQPRSPIPTLLPSCSFFLRIPYAPARQLMEADLPVALATDNNPGSTPSGNMNFVLSLACIQLRMLPEEAINAMTINAAAAMQLGHELGSIARGRRASFIITNKIPSLAYLPYAFGSDHIDSVFIDGEPIRSGEVTA